MEFIYSRAHLVLDLLQELEIEFRNKSFGIIPIKQRGGSTILKALQQNISPIMDKTELINFDYNNNGFDVELNSETGPLQARSKYLVLATGGYSGQFENTDNSKYKSYNIFDIVRKNGGSIINTDCIFSHPFGYSGGKKVLIGGESQLGEFEDDNGDYVFNEKTRKLIKDDDYHEIFDQLLKQAENCRKKGLSVYFIGPERKELIVPSVHYTSGGIKTDHLGNVIGHENLFAIGECQANGSRKNGRFPGYPFTAAIVCAKVLGEYFSKNFK
jgi:aspartate oxidase